MKNILIPIALVAFSLGACKNKEEKHDHEEPASMVTKTETTTSNKDIVVTGDIVFVNLTGDDQMLYNINEIKVKSGQTIKLTLKNIGKLPAEAMSHNFVLLKKEVNPSAFAMQALKAVDEHYMPASMADQTIAHTAMLGPGQTDAIEFAAPEKGSYDYICTFPGHFSVMKGKLIVE